MAKHKTNMKLFIVLVDAHHAAVRYRGANRGYGRWCVCAKNGKEAEKVLASHIGKTHGSIHCYYEVEEGSAEHKQYAHLTRNECEKVC